MAWSGGLDSTVLLHRLVAVRRAAPRALRLRAVHVDHHLQSASRAFARHCRRIGRQWRVPLTVVDVRVQARGGSPEEQARDARYAALRAALRPGELLLTAQHADDQFETLLLALLRGAGPAGLAGMPEAMAFGAGWLLRPLLGETRARLEAEARAAGLSWVDDPTNPDPRFDRNYLRQRVLPVLRERWPGLAATGARSARFCGVAAGFTQQAARRDVCLAADGNALEAAVLRRLTAQRAAEAVRVWIADQGARVPDERRLREILRMLEVRVDASPRVRWDQWQAGLSRGRLFLKAVSAQRPVDAQQPVMDAPQQVEPWCWRSQPRLPLAGGAWLAVKLDAHGDVDLDLLPLRMRVHWHVAGQAAPAFASQRRLRKLFQDLAVPADARAGLPLVSTWGEDDAPPRLLAIADLWVESSVRAGATTRHAGRFVWRPPA